ncbi:hypothetical protein PRIPAC_89579 [Pristionchus pacificus]|uniref:Peptidase n=1 Tax=Pristionchus pacificus TaxID=54126 RepID=A0A2A6CXJ5_PRIPA|nr:hypothetical protein PRIPAC_89579 [Pristionchus pacificus]|eukprot:PDM82753.1 Peptidase [Pristionchus pacificus]
MQALILLPFPLFQIALSALFKEGDDLSDFAEVFSKSANFSNLRTGNGHDSGKPLFEVEVGYDANSMGYEVTVKNHHLNFDILESVEKIHLPHLRSVFEQLSSVNPRSVALLVLSERLTTIDRIMGINPSYATELDITLDEINYEESDNHRVLAMKIMERRGKAMLRSILTKDYVSKRKIDGRITEYENLADHTGMRAAIRAFDNYETKNGQVKAIRINGREFTSKQQFFLGFAVINVSITTQHVFLEFFQHKFKTDIPEINKYYSSSSNVLKIVFSANGTEPPVGTGWEAEFTGLLPELI